MKLPVVGKLIISKEISMFARTFSALQKNNVLLTDSIEILAKITSNEIYKELEYNKEYELKSSFQAFDGVNYKYTIKFIKKV